MASWERSLLFTTMASHTNNDQDNSMHFVLRPDIRVVFKEPTKTPKRLEVKINNENVELSYKDKEVQNGLEIHRWTLLNELRFFPVDIVTLRLMHGKRRRCFFPRGGKIEEMELSHEDIEIKEPEQATVTLVRQKFTITLEVVRRDITDIDSSVAVEDLENLSTKRVEELISSSKSFFENLKELRSILENIPVTEDIWIIIEGAIETLGEAHPLAKAVLTALSIPYNFLRNEHEFKQNVKDLADVMHFTCKCLVDVRYHTKITSAKTTFVSIMRTLQDAALYINSYTSKGNLAQVFAAQFPTKLETYAEDLLTLKNNFQMAMVMQIVRDVDNIATMTSEDFLRRRLCPIDAEVHRLGEGCMVGTRVDILQEVRDWLQDYKAKNILWLVGAPGVGKSTIATSIATKLADTAPFCARFFCKRDEESLRDSHRVWRTLAHGLADKHDGIKAFLMQIVIEKKTGDLQDLPVFDQFLKLVKAPLETVFSETSFRSTQSTYPVLIIDALDECHSVNDDNWTHLLESLACWAKLPKVLKLIVTSRDNRDIGDNLGGISHRISLSTGDGVSSDSNSDIKLFFTKKFEEISLRLRREFKDIPSDWPGESVIQKMTDYAAGLFVWADMVVNYVGLRVGGSDPFERLQAVLGDIETHSGIDGAVQVDRLYARIIIEAFQHSRTPERARARSTLAVIVLAKIPLRKSDLVELQSTDVWDARFATESTLHLLSPLIRRSNSGGDALRVCHNSVTDFLLSQDRSTAAMDYFLKQWNQKRPADQVSDAHSFIVDHEVESWNLVFSCLRLIHRQLSRDLGSINRLLKQSSISLDYASCYWFGHLEDAGARRMPDLKCLASAMETAYNCLRRFSSDLMSVEEETVALVKIFRDAAHFASWCITSQQLTIDSRQELVQRTKVLDIARGDFQIAMVAHLAKGVGGSTLDKTDASDTFLRKRLQPSDQTMLDNKCLEGTRTSVIREAKDWLKDLDQPNILWIFGAPGSGKSAVATTLVDEFRNMQLCAKVFAKRDFADRRDPMLVWRTLAYDLAGLHAGLKGSIMVALNDCPLHFEHTTQTQLRFRDLVINAMRQQQYLSIVTVIDALDECWTDHSEHWRTLLETLTDWGDLPRSFKLVVTSRDIPDIRSALEKTCHPICLTTGSEASLEQKHDIKWFLRGRLAEIPSFRVNEEMLEELTGYAAGSFIWAKLVAGLVGKIGAVAPLKDILSGVHGDGDIDVLYGHLLSTALGPLDKSRRDITRSFLATLVLARDPLRKSDLAEFVDPSQSSLEERRQLADSMVEELSSIISVDDHQLFRIPHKSFADFLLDRERSSIAMKRLLPSDDDVHSYLVDLEKDSAKLCIACLRSMNNSLKFNACEIKTSYALNETSLAELGGRISKNLGSSLVYACRFWAEHLRHCNGNDHSFRALATPLLDTLLRKNLLYYLEILSLAKAVPSAVRSLDIAAGFLEGHDDELAEVAKDVVLFVQMFEEPIAAAAPHIYLSAVPFCPSNSSIARIYGPQFPNVLSVVNGRRINWDAASSSATGDAYIGAVSGVAFSPDGWELVSVTADFVNGTVRIWDAGMGEALSTPLTGHDGAVWCVSVSPDGSLIASGDKSGNLRIWDSNTGACPHGSIRAHAKSTSIWSVAFSPDGSQIVTGSEDSTVNVWNAASGDLHLGPLTGHTNDVHSVAFSPDGSTIASGSFDETIRIWDAHTGESLMEPLTGHTGRVQCIAFSPDGRQLASASSDNTLRLWDVARGFSQISAIAIGSPIFSFSFSPDSNCLVSGSFDGALRFWNVSSGSCSQLGVSIYGHIHDELSVAFAPDGLSVASGGYDSSIKLWTVPTTPALGLPTAAVEDSEHPNTATLESSDACGQVILSDESFIDENGWMHRDVSRRGGSGVLFWVPGENRGGVWWPRSTVVIHQNVTKIDFSRFVHGENWTKCRASE